MSNQTEVIDKIKNGEDLFVRLGNNRGRHYVESYDLSTIVIFKDKFWGKFRNVHSPLGHDELGGVTPLSYAYNNFCNVVCTMSLSHGIQRFCSSRNYESINFLTKNKNREIWNSQNSSDLNLLKEAVNQADRMKLVVKGKNELTYIVPIHTVELYDDGLSFGLDTELDGIPFSLINFEYMESLSKKLDDVSAASPKEAYINTRYQSNVDFHLISFYLGKSGICQKAMGPDGKMQTVTFDYEYFKIYAEK